MVPSSVSAVEIRFFFFFFFGICRPAAECGRDKEDGKG